MCLILDHSPQMKIATRNIPVYKYISKYGGGWLYNLKIDNKFEPWTPGFHYTEPDFKREALKSNFIYGNSIVEDNAFHSSKTIEHLLTKSASSSDIIVKMYIPRGARYYENKNEYASSSLVYPETEF